MGSTKEKWGMRTSGMGSTTRNGLEDCGDGVYQGAMGHEDLRDGVYQEKWGCRPRGWGSTKGNRV